MTKEMIIHTAICQDKQVIDVIYQYNGVWCCAQFSIDSMLGFGLLSGHQFTKIKNGTPYHWVLDFNTNQITDLELMSNYMDHILCKKEYHARMIDIEMNPDCEGDILELLEGTKALMAER